MMPLEKIPITLACSPAEESIISNRSEELIGYIENALLNTFSQRQARKTLQSFGLTKTSAELIVRWAVSQAPIRQNLASRFRQRTYLGITGLVLAASISLVPAVTKVFVGAIATCAVYALLSFLNWKKYLRPVFEK